MPPKKKQYTNPFLKGKGSTSDQNKNDLMKLNEAVAFHQQGQLDRANEIYLEILEKNPQNKDASHLLGVISLQTGDFQNAITWISRAIEIDSKIASYHSNLGLALHSFREFDAAVGCFTQALLIQSDYADAYFNRGNALLELIQLDAAIKDFDKALALNSSLQGAYLNRGNAFRKLKNLEASISDYTNLIAINPQHADAYINLGSAYQELLRYEDALSTYQTSIRLMPNNAAAYFNQGITLQSLNRTGEAIASYNKATQLKPDYFDAFYNLGFAYQQKKCLTNAVNKYTMAIELRPEMPEVYLNRGGAYLDLKEFEAALLDSDQAIRLKPNYAEAYYNKGNTLQELKKYVESIQSYTSAINVKPDYVEAYYNRAIVLQELDLFKEAVEDYTRAIDLQPDLTEAYLNRGNALKELKDLDAAEASYDEAINLSPSYPEAYCNKSLCLLLAGRLSESWKDYEWRLEIKEKIQLKRLFRQQVWRGNENLKDKTVLIHAEQGLGDTIQFCRYVGMVADLGAKVIFEVQRPLVQFLKQLPRVNELIAYGDTLPDFDYHCPLLSLPLAFKTDINSIPSAPQYLIAESDRVALWKNRLGSDSFKIGISWQGSTGPGAKGRSFNLAQLEKIAQLPNVQLISLQKGYGSEQLQNLPQGMKVIELGDSLDTDGAFLDTAAVMKNLDLVISCDTAVVHLAGALRVKTWVALKFVPDWRWMLDRTDSPWYPSLTLYHQEVAGEWGPVFDKMRHDLIAEFQNK